MIILYVLLSLVILLQVISIVLTVLKKSGNGQLFAELGKTDNLIRDEFSRSRGEEQRAGRETREEISNSFNKLGSNLSKHIGDLSAMQHNRLESFSLQLQALTRNNEEKFEKFITANDRKQSELREMVERRLQVLQEGNEQKLEAMRLTVDEKLHATVEKRFNESFKLISDRLEQVHKGLGEMQTLATGVGDLKKVLANVKTRGNLGEIQLGAILEEIFSPEQFDRNAIIKDNSLERVEFVIKLPGNHENNQPLLLPIDSKFPNEDYQRLVDAYDNVATTDTRQMDSIIRQFESAVKKSAKDIRDKYIHPPVTTDFAIMFVPTEGLYAEILRRTGLFETIRREYRVTIVGPTNLVAFLNSLQMGFRTLAIEKRSSEVWEILGAVKTQFGEFATVLERTKKKLQEATNHIDKAGVRSRAIERQLRKVQELPQEQAAKLIGEALEQEAQDMQDEVDEDKETGQ